MPDPSAASSAAVSPDGERPAPGAEDPTIPPPPKRVYVFLGRLAGSRVDAFHLPPNRTAVLGGTLKI